MPIDDHLHIRSAGTWDTGWVADLTMTAFASTPLGRWLDPEQQRTRAYVTDLLHRPGILVRVVEDAGTIIGAAVWTSCTGLATREDVDLPHTDDRADAHWLRTRLIHLHPAHAHRHLRLLVTDAARRRQEIGTALLIDPASDCAARSGSTEQAQASSGSNPRYAVLPDYLTRAASRAGYRAVDYAVRVPRTGITVQPHWRAGHSQQPRPAAAVSQASTPTGAPAS
jgi:hypothetical protein